MAPFWVFLYLALLVVVQFIGNMQALSIWPSKVGFLVVPQLEFEVGGFGFVRTSSVGRKRCSPVGPLCLGRRAAVLLVSCNNSRFSRRSSENIDWRFGFLSRSPKFKILLFSELKRGFFGALIALAWTLEQQEIESEVMIEEESNLVDGFKGKLNSGNDDNGDVDRGEDGNESEHKGENGDFENDNGGEIEEETTRIDVRALAHSLQFAITADDVEEVLKEKGELPLQVYSTIIRGFGKDKQMQCAMAVVEWLKKKGKETGVIGPNLFIYNSLLGAAKQCGQFGIVENILNDMDQEGVLPNIVTYNTLMAIYLEQGEARKALQILEEIKEKGFTPSPVSYSTALLAFRRMEDGSSAVKFFVELREKYSKGEIGKDYDEDWENEFIKLENFTIRICYQVMRRWLVKNENLSSKVLKLLTEMDIAGLKPGRAEHERLIWACTREEHHIVGKELYKRIRERHQDISLSVCNHLIWLMGKAKKWWAALEIYENLLDKGPKPNNMSYELIVSHFTILLTAASKRGIWRWGVRLLNKMEDKGLKPGSRQWNAVLVACSKASETAAAIQVFRRMVEQGEKPTIISYGALLSALEKGKLYDEALRVFEHMLKVGVEPNLYAFTIMASIFTAQGKFKLLDAIFREMASSGVEPTVVTYNAIISSCGRNGMSSAAYEWFHRMKTENISPNEITYEMLIEALANDGKPRLAYELYLRAQNEGLDLSAKAYDAVVQSSQIYGATIDLNLLGHRPPDKKKIGKKLTEFSDSG